MFQLEKAEKDELVTICDRFTKLKHSSVNPYAFTENGVAMLSSVLNSEAAVMVNIQIMRAFVKLRKVISENKDLQKVIQHIEQRLDVHDRPNSSGICGAEKLFATTRGASQKTLFPG